MAAQRGRSPVIDTAAVPLVNGRPYDYTQEIRKGSKTAGIYGVRLCKTEILHALFQTVKKGYIAAGSLLQHTP